MTKRHIPFLLALGVLGGVGCSSLAGNEASTAAPPGAVLGTPGSSPSFVPESDGASSSVPPEAGAAVDECNVGERACADHATQRVCTATPLGRKWVDTTCAAGSGCYLGTCTPAKCSDECILGATNGAKQCETFDMASGSWSALDPAASTHDRARGYISWLQRKQMPNGGVVVGRYADPPSYTQLVAIGDVGDSAIVTGNYLASEAMRLATTGAADARANVLHLIDTLHFWFNVSGDPGVLARYVAPAGQHPYGNTELDCSNVPRVHCNVPYQGKSYDYIGQVSRDQYQGVILGYSLAYEALTSADEAAKQVIRDDVLELIDELMKERTLPLEVTYKGVTVDTTISVRFVVPVPSEMKGGRAFIDGDHSDTTQLAMYGLQEFTPDLGDVLHQVPILSIGVPRTSSAIQLSSFFEVALQVMDGIPALKKKHDEIRDYFLYRTGKGGNVFDWLAVAKQTRPYAGCGGGFYAVNIALEPMYDLARLEKGPLLSSVIQNDVFKDKIWSWLGSEKNVFFSFMYAGTVTAADPSIGPFAAAQLAQFPPAPRVHHGVDLRNDPRYMPHDSTCPDQVDHSMAVDVGDRQVRDFIWGVAPWGLYDPGDEAEVKPGVDYLIAYWMGRKHGFVADDAPNRCLAWH